MLTRKQIKDHSEITVKTSATAHYLDSYKAKLSYLKDGEICRLSIVDNFMPPLALTDKALQEWGKNEIKSFIPASKWDAFAHFVNESEILTKDMLLSWQEVKMYQENHREKNLGTYKMLRYGEVEDIDVQANIRAIYDMALEAYKVF